MARLLITNSKDKYEKVLSDNIDAGLSNFDEFKSKGLFLAAHKKRRVPIYNLYKNKNEFCSVVGSCIYKGKVGKEALEGIFKEFNGEPE